MLNNKTVARTVVIRSPQDALRQMPCGSTFAFVELISIPFLFHNQLLYILQENLFFVRVEPRDLALAQTEHTHL